MAKTNGASRREFLLDVAAGAIAIGAPIDRAIAATTTRYDIASPQGQRMLTLYAKAVAAMQDPKINYPPQPQNWTFQAYIHGVPKYPFDPANSGGLYGGTDELRTRIDQIYGNPAAGTPQAAWKQAALACWGTCPHGSPWFTTWHRWYLYYFEQICRAMCGDASFTLPYWNYGSNTSTAQQLPAMFRTLPTDPKDHNPLYFDDRGLGYPNTQASGTQNVAMNQGGYMPFTQSNYRPSRDAKAMFPSDTTFIDVTAPHDYAMGFTGRMECVPHDMVHDNVGGWMGSIPSAAGDPIFYAHHVRSIASMPPGRPATAPSPAPTTTAPPTPSRRSRSGSIGRPISSMPRARSSTSCWVSPSTPPPSATPTTTPPPSARLRRS